jgi:hypothetical protein
VSESKDITYRVYLGSKKIDEFIKSSYWPFIWAEGMRLQRRFRRRVRWFQVTKITHIHYRLSVRVQVKMVGGSYVTHPSEDTHS